MFVLKYVYKCVIFLWKKSNSRRRVGGFSQTPISCGSWGFAPDPVFVTPLYYENLF